jgi:hypothetical protein
VSNSPYQLTNTIQIAGGVTVEVEAGVVIDGSLTNLMFLVQGELLVKGTQSNPVRLTGKPRAFFSNEGAKASAKIDLSGISFEGGGAIMPPSGNAGYSTFTMRFCEIVNVSGYSYIWYPSGTSIVEFNSFKNSAGFSVGFDARTSSESGYKRVVFRNNLFSGPSTSGYWIQSWAAYGSALEVEENSFLGGPYNALSLRYDSGKIIASRNFWGTSDSSRIQDMVTDQNDSLSYGSTIDVSSPLALPSVSTPSKFLYSAAAVPTTPTPTPKPTPTPTPKPTPTPTPTPKPTPTPSASATKPTSTESTQDPSSSEEIEIEAEEDNEPYIEATVVGGKTRFIVGGEPKTKYRVEATLRGKKKTFTVTTNSNGEIAFRSSLNLKNYSVRLLLGSKVLAKTTVR